MPVTIKQVAERAGVSRGTVDRVIHGRPGVRPQVAAHVRAIADEMGFEPNKVARLLALRKREYRIACVYPRNLDGLEDGFREAMSECADYGVSIEFKPVTGYEASRHADTINEQVSEGFNALCVTSPDTEEVRTAVNDATQKGIVVVTAGIDISDSRRRCYIGGDYAAEGATAAGMLALRRPGRLNLLIVTAPLAAPNHNERVQVFGRTLVTKGVNSKLIYLFEEHGNYNRTYATIVEALKNKPEINCVYVAGDGASAVARAVLDLGLEDRVAIVASDGSQLTRELIQEGSIEYAVCQNFLESGRRAVRTIFDIFLSGETEEFSGHNTDIKILIKENC